MVRRIRSKTDRDRPAYKAKTSTWCTRDRGCLDCTAAGMPWKRARSSLDQMLTMRSAKFVIDIRSMQLGTLTTQCDYRKRGEHHIIEQNKRNLVKICCVEADTLHQPTCTHDGERTTYLL